MEQLKLSITSDFAALTKKEASDVTVSRSCSANHSERCLVPWWSSQSQGIKQLPF